MVRFAISVAQVLLYQLIDIGKLSWKSDLSLMFWIIASKAQSPAPGLDEPCLMLMPCFFALACTEFN